MLWNSIFKIFLYSFILTLLSCGTLTIFEDAGKPYSILNKVPEQPVRDSMVVLSFNIEKAKKIELAISELKKFDDVNPVAIYLLQEMDEEGVKSIASALGLNYLFIPIVYYKVRKQVIGNAILTKSRIQTPEKLILPNKKWINGRKRHVAIGEVTVGDKKILVYSVHTETSSMARKKRMEQWDAILQHAGNKAAQYKYMMIGGDFNTLFSKDAKTVVQKFTAAGFQCATDSVGPTAKALYGLIKPREDYIFSRGFQILDAGKIDSSKASDHLPVYAVFR
jgi:endonuclease/exonuclease/phosphatase family metal-dependent hydrolase